MSDNRRDDDLLTTGELAKYLGVTPRQLRYKIKKRLCPRPIRLAGSVRWRWRTIREWMEAVDTMRRLRVKLERVEIPKDVDSGKSVTQPEIDSSSGKKPR